MVLLPIHFDLEDLVASARHRPPTATMVAVHAAIFIALVFLGAMVVLRAHWWCAGAVVLGADTAWSRPGATMTRLVPPCRHGHAYSALLHVHASCYLSLFSSSSPSSGVTGQASLSKDAGHAVLLPLLGLLLLLL
jgi:hypothetical protein